MKAALHQRKRHTVAHPKYVEVGPAGRDRWREHPSHATERSILTTSHRIDMPSVNTIASALINPLDLLPPAAAHDTEEKISRLTN